MTTTTAMNFTTPHPSNFPSCCNFLQPLAPQTPTGCANRERFILIGSNENLGAILLDAKILSKNNDWKAEQSVLEVT